MGNLHHFLPLIVKMVEHDQEKRLLSLHALKEVSLWDQRLETRLIVTMVIDCDTLLTWPTGDGRRYALDATIREFGKSRRDDPQCCCSMPGKTHHYASWSLPPTAPCKLANLAHAELFVTYMLLGSHQRSQPRHEGYGPFCYPLYLRGKRDLVRRSTRWSYHGLLVSYQ